MKLLADAGGVRTFHAYSLKTANALGVAGGGARDGALRGLAAGAIFGVGILLAHAVAGTDAKVSLGSFPSFLIVIDATAGALLSALGGRVAGSGRQAD